MRRLLQKSIQISLLVLFITMIALGKVQIWMMLFIAGILASFIFSRLYCGYVCPINTVIQGSNWLKKKFKIKDRPIPGWLKNPWVRTVILILFFAIAIFTQITKIAVPVWPTLFIIGFLLTLFYPELLWHRYLCPYGAILRFPAKTAHLKMQIDTASCINCGACARVCPTATIRREPLIEGQRGSHVILTDECLVCHVCEDVCRVDAIAYRKH